MILEIFRVGLHTDNNGNQKYWTQNDLDAIVAIYEIQKETREAPVVLGHPNLEDPAYGWIEKVWREGQTLYAKIKDTSKEIAKLIKGKKYPNWSISLYSDLGIRHLGLLGAAQPALDGLKVVKFNQDEKFISIKYSGENMDELEKARLEIERLRNENEKITNENTAFSEKVEKLETENKGLSDSIEANAKAEAKKLEANSAKSNKEFSQKAVENGNIFNSQKDRLEKILNAVDPACVNFSQENEIDVKAEIIELVKASKISLEDDAFESFNEVDNAGSDPSVSEGDMIAKSLE